MIRFDLPKNVKALCDETVPFTSESLFGDDLNSKVKEVNEMNKLVNKVNDNPRPYFNNSARRGGRFRGNSFRGRGRRGNNRYSPYTAPKKGQSLNKSGPSKA